MEDIVLLLDKNDLAVTLEGNSLRIQQADDKTRHVPLGMLGQMVVYGRPPVSCDVWRALADRNIPAVLLPGRGRGGAAYMGGGLSASVRARAAQHEALRNPETAAAVRRWVLDKKIAGHVMPAGRLAGMAKAAAGKNEPMRLFGGEVSRTGLVEKAARTVEIMENRGLALANETGADAMMGHEGVAANAWYEFLTRTLGIISREFGANDDFSPIPGSKKGLTLLSLCEILQLIQVDRMSRVLYMKRIATFLSHQIPSGIGPDHASLMKRIATTTTLLTSRQNPSGPCLAYEEDCDDHHSFDLPPESVRTMSRL